MTLQFNNKLNTVTGYEFPEDKVISAWLWHSPDTFDTSKREELFTYSNKENINTIYLSIDAYIDLYELPDSTSRSEKLKDFEKSITNFINQAEQHDIKVHALAGSTKWANDSHEYLPLLLLNFVIEYNKKNTGNAFSGMHYDIEFYNDETFSDDKEYKAAIYLRLINSLVTTINEDTVLQKSSFDLGFAVPYWFDKENEIMPQIEWEGRRKPIGNHIIDILSSYDKSYIAIMAYRKQAQGDNNTIELVKDEIAYIQDNNKNVSVMIAQETAEAEEKNISFFGEDKKVFKEEVKKITAAYDDNPAFKGIAIHHLQSYKEL